MSAIRTAFDNSQNWPAMKLDYPTGQNAFTSVPPRGDKHGPEISPHSAAANTAKVLVDNSKLHYVIANRVDSVASKDKTARIVGKSMPNWKNA